MHLLFFKTLILAITAFQNHAFRRSLPKNLRRETQIYSVKCEWRSAVAILYYPAITRDAAGRLLFKIARPAHQTRLNGWPSTSSKTLVRYL